MKKTLIIITLSLLTSMGYAQTKPDSIKFSPQEIEMLKRNLLVIQQSIHRLDMSALLRDKLDSVYSQSAVLLEERSKPRPVKKKP